MKRPIGLIAGKGKFPLLLAQEAQKQNQPLVVIALKEEMNQDLSPLAQSLHWISVAKMGSIIDTLKEAGVAEAVMAGRVEHTKLFSDLVPDFRAAQLLFKLKDRRADSILKAVADEFEKDGIRLMPSTLFLEHMLAEVGAMTSVKLSDKDEKNVSFGIRMALGLSALDIGQTVVVKRRTVVAAEAIEGTDACIRRAGEVAGEHCVVVKSAKPNQDLRFDVPIVGLNTLKVMCEAKSKVIALEAGKTLMLEKENFLKVAEENGIAVFGWKREQPS